MLQASTYQIEENGARDVAAPRGFVEVHIDALQLEVALPRILHSVKQKSNEIGRRTIVVEGVELDVKVQTIASAITVCVRTYRSGGINAVFVANDLQKLHNTFTNIRRA